jgi:hypothetical protein
MSATAWNKSTSKIVSGSRVAIVSPTAAKAALFGAKTVHVPPERASPSSKI